MLKAWILARSAVVATLMLQIPAAAQRVDATRIIDLHINAEAENRSFSASVLDGNRLRITIHRVDTFEIVPVVVNEAQGMFGVTVYHGRVGAETDDLRAVETVTARIGVPVALRSMPMVG